MDRPRQFAAGLSLLCACAAGAWAVTPSPRPDKPAATEACEAATAETIRGMRGRGAQEVQFSGARRAGPPAAGGDDGNTTVAGSGSYRGSAGAATAFTYTCAYDAESGKASGVVLREARPAAQRAETAWEPDLTHVSPEACEAAAAAALKDKYPPIGRITFQSDSRQLKAAPNARTSLEGQGRLERAAGMNPAPFSYRCVLETRSGRIVSVTTSD